MVVPYSHFRPVSIHPPFGPDDQKEYHVNNLQETGHFFVTFWNSKLGEVDQHVGIDHSGTSGINHDVLHPPVFQE
jgi:hypothetical protein